MKNISEISSGAYIHSLLWSISIFFLFLPFFQNSKRRHIKSRWSSKKTFIVNIKIITWSFISEKPPFNMPNLLYCFQSLTFLRNFVELLAVMAFASALKVNHMVLNLINFFIRVFIHEIPVIELSMAFKIEIKEAGYEYPLSGTIFPL